MSFCRSCFLIILFLFSCKKLSPQLPVAELTIVPNDFDMEYQVLVLNLVDSGDKKVDEISKSRWERISKNLEESKVPFKRFPGVYGKKYKKDVDLSKPEVLQRFGDNDEYMFRNIAGLRELTYGELGHLLSFYEIAKKIIADDKITVILEDDAVPSFKKDLIQRIESLLSHAPKDWDIIYLNCRNKHTEIIDGGRFGKIPPEWVGNTAQIYTPKAAKKIKEMIMPFYHPTDMWLGRLLHKFNSYCAYPELFYPFDSPSTIDLQGQR